MPIYEYHCAKCGTKTEVMQKMNDRPITKCEKCGKDTLEKQISRSSFSLKGGGWYSDGYSSSNTSTTKGDQPSSSSSTNTKKACGQSECACEAAMV